MNMRIGDIDYFNMRKLLKDCLYEVQANAANSGIPGIPSGFQSLDDLTSGFERGKVYVIGGRPCMGKEELMLSMIRNITMESKMPVLLFSTNNMKSDYIERLLTIHSEIPTLRLHQGLLELYEWERIDQKVETLVEAPLYIHDSLDLPLNELIETSRNCIREIGTRIIIIDCLQMIDFANDDENSSERIAKVMCSLKQMASQFHIPIVVGSLLGRGVEYREGIEGKRPQLMDLANSSYIEGLADVIMMVHRHEYYHIYLDDNGRDLRGRIEVIVKKNALKPLGSILLDYHEKTGVVCMKNKNTTSKPVDLKKMNMDNDAVRKLITTFDLKEELPELPF